MIGLRGSPPGPGTRAISPGTSLGTGISTGTSTGTGMKTEGGSVHVISAVALQVQLAALPFPGFGRHEDLVILGTPPTHGGSHFSCACQLALNSASSLALAQVGAVSVELAVVVPAQAAGKMAFSPESLSLRLVVKYEGLEM